MGESLLQDSAGRLGQTLDSEIPLWPEIGVVGISYKTTTLAKRESLARQITIEKIEELKSRRSSSESEFALLSTCNRVEIYYSSEKPGIAKDLLSLFRLDGKDSLDVYHYVGLRAARHLLNVATGLDSLVFGEAQILSQVNECNRMSAERKVSGPILSRLFSKAYKSARKLREENPTFAKGLNNSVSHAILEMIDRQYSDAKPNLLLIGSGKMVRLAVGALDRSKLGTVVVAARRKELDKIRADSIIQLSEIVKTLDEKMIDVVITATAAEDYILKKSDLELISKKSVRRILILDISVPRNVDPAAGELPNVTLVNLDDLKGVTDSPNDQDREIASKIRQSILHQSDEFFSWLLERSQINPLMSALRKRAETIRSEEVKNAFSRMSELTPEQRSVIETMSQRLLRRFLHEPSERLKELTRSEESERAKLYTEAIIELFAATIDGESERSEVYLEDHAEL